MVFVPALTTFVISDFLGGSKVLLIGNVIEQQFTQVGDWNVGSGLSLVLMIFAFSKSTGYALAAMVVASAAATLVMRAFQFCFTMISSKPSLFGKVK